MVDGAEVSQMDGEGPSSWDSGSEMKPVEKHTGNPFRRRTRKLRLATILKRIELLSAEHCEPRLGDPFALRKVFFGFFLVPIKFVALCTTTVVAAVLCCIVMIGAPASRPDEPLSQKRRILIQRIIRTGSRCLLLVLGLSIKEHIQQDPDEASLEDNEYVIVSNHVSFVDIFYIYWRFAPSFLSKAEVRDLPLVGTIAKSIQCIFVDRESGTTASATKQIQQRVHTPGFPPTLVFPEGTTSNNEALLPFRSGAFLAGAPVKILCFDYGVDDFDIAYLDLRPLTLFLILCEPRLNLTVHWLPLYRPSDAEKSDPRFYAQNVRAEIQKVLQVPYSDLTLKERNERRMSREFPVNHLHDE